MPYEFLPHTADVRIKVESDSLEQLFCEAVDAVMEYLKAEISEGGKPVTRTIEVESIDRSGLLIDFLSQVLGDSEIYDEVYKVNKIIELTDTEIKVEVTGRPIVSRSEDIKGVTYHEADVKKDGKGKWSTIIVLDI